MRCVRRTTCPFLTAVPCMESRWRVGGGVLDFIILVLVIITTIIIISIIISMMINKTWGQ